MQKYKLCRVDWVDASSSTQWVNINEVDVHPCVVASVGWLISEKKGHVVLAQNMSSNGNCADRIQIPTKWITKRTYLAKNIVGYE